MSRAYAYMRKVVRIRSRLIATGRSLSNDAHLLRIIKPLKAWLDAYPNASEHGAMNVLKRYESEIRMLIPGSSSKCHNKLIRELEDLLNQTI